MEEGAGPAHGKEASECGRVFEGGGRLCGGGWVALAVAPGWMTLYSMLNCRSTCAAASWVVCWARAWMSGRVAVAAPGKRTVGSRECMPACEAVAQMAATELAAQTWTPEAATRAAAPVAAMWAVASATGTRAAARGVATCVEAARWLRTLGVVPCPRSVADRECGRGGRELT